MQTPHEMPRNMRIYLHQLQPCLVVTAKPCERLRCPSRRLSGGLQAVCTRHLGRVSLSAADKRCSQWRGPHQRRRAGLCCGNCSNGGKQRPRPGQARPGPSHFVLVLVQQLSPFHSIARASTPNLAALRPSCPPAPSPSPPAPLLSIVVDRVAACATRTLVPAQHGARLRRCQPEHAPQLLGLRLCQH